VVVGGVLYPVWREVPDYPFWLSNIIFIVVFFTFARWIFFTRHTFFAGKQRLKIFVIAVSVPVIFLLISELNFFQTSIDEERLENALSHLDGSRQEQLFSYIRNEMIFFGTGSIIAAIILPFKMAV